jgi:hypothetical protein
MSGTSNLPPPPGVPPSNRSPVVPQAFKFGGRVLAILAAVYFLAYWFLLLSFHGNNGFISGFAALVFAFAPIVLCIADWRGFTTLAGLIHWDRMSGGQKFWMGVVFVVFLFFYFAPAIYFIRAIIQHYRATQQHPATQLRGARQRFLTSSRRTQVITGAVALLVVAGFCGVSSAAASPNGSVFGLFGTSANPQIASATNTPNALANVSGGSTSTPVVFPTEPPAATSTPQPTAIPTATNTPVPPTATPVPLYCNPICNPWGYDFNPGKYIYSPPSNFCQYFNCIGSFWSSTNGYVEECQDKTCSHSGGVSGSCSSHGGNWRPLYSH